MGHEWPVSGCWAGLFTERGSRPCLHCSFTQELWMQTNARGPRPVTSEPLGRRPLESMQLTFLKAPLGHSDVCRSLASVLLYPVMWSSSSSTGITCELDSNTSSQTSPLTYLLNHSLHCSKSSFPRWCPWTSKSEKPCLETILRFWFCWSGLWPGNQDC